MSKKHWESRYANPAFRNLPKRDKCVAWDNRRNRGFESQLDHFYNLPMDAAEALENPRYPLTYPAVVIRTSTQAQILRQERQTIYQYIRNLCREHRLRVINHVPIRLPDDNELFSSSIAIQFPDLLTATKFRLILPYPSTVLEKDNKAVRVTG